MQPDFHVESRTYDQVVRGSWQAYQLPRSIQLSDEALPEIASDCLQLWLPAGTPMRWSTHTHPLRYNCLQFFWPNRWYMLSAFYNGRALKHTYATVILPPTATACPLMESFMRPPFRSETASHRDQHWSLFFTTVLAVMCELLHMRG